MKVVLFITGHLETIGETKGVTETGETERGGTGTGETGREVTGTEVTEIEGTGRGVTSIAPAHLAGFSLAQDHRSRDTLLSAHLLPGARHVAPLHLIGMALPLLGARHAPLVTLRHTRRKRRGRGGAFLCTSVSTYQVSALVSSDVSQIRLSTLIVWMTFCKLHTEVPLGTDLFLQDFPFVLKFLCILFSLILVGFPCSDADVRCGVNVAEYGCIG